MIVEDWIEFAPQPKELLLVWQAPRHYKDRSRWVVGRLRETDEGVAFEYIQEPEFSELNLGRSQSELHVAGYAGYPAFDLKKGQRQVFQESALEAFMRRLPPSARSDFPDYLAHHRLKTSNSLSPFSILAVTEARLPSDGFSLIDPLDAKSEWLDTLIEIAGFRHVRETGVALSVGDWVDLIAEPSNPIDPRAIQMKTSGAVIGYINRLQAPTVGTWLTDREVSCRIARINGRPEAPRAYALLQVRPAKRSIAA